MVRRLSLAQQEIIRENLRPDEAGRPAVAPDVVKFAEQAVRTVREADQTKIHQRSFQQPERRVAPAAEGFLLLLHREAAQVLGGKRAEAVGFYVLGKGIAVCSQPCPDAVVFLHKEVHGPFQAAVIQRFPGFQDEIQHIDVAAGGNHFLGINILLGKGERVKRSFHRPKCSFLMWGEANGAGRCARLLRRRRETGFSASRSSSGCPGRHRKPRPCSGAPCKCLNRRSAVPRRSA